MSSDKYDWVLGSSPPALDQHSAAKHAVLRTYVRRYIDILTSDPRRDALNLTLVDGFAGGGEYSITGGTAPGSPLILLEETACAQARFNAERRKPFALRSEHIFVERKRSNFEYLREVVRKSPHGHELDQTIQILNADFAAVLPGIIERVRQRGSSHRAIFFLDQYGYSEVSFAHIRSILDNLANPEIIVTFNVDFLIDYLSANDAFLKAVTPVELGLDDVRHMLDLKDGDQRDARWLIQHFLYRHLMEKTGAPFYTCFFVKSPESHRSYWLVHMSKHPRARDEMAERHWAMSNHFVHHGGAGLNMLGFDPQQDVSQIPLDFMFDDDAQQRSKDALITELPPLIFDRALGGGGGVTLERLFTRICNETPATTGLVSNVLMDLRGAGEIEIVSKDGKSRPRATNFQWSDVILPAKQRTLFSKVWPSSAA